MYRSSSYIEEVIAAKLRQKDKGRKKTQFDARLFVFIRSDSSIKMEALCALPCPQRTQRIPVPYLIKLSKEIWLSPLPSLLSSLLWHYNSASHLCLCIVWGALSHLETLRLQYTLSIYGRRDYPRMQPVMCSIVFNPCQPLLSRSGSCFRMEAPCSLTWMSIVQQICLASWPFPSLLSPLQWHYNSHGHMYSSYNVLSILSNTWPFMSE